MVHRSLLAELIDWSKLIHLQVCPSVCYPCVPQRYIIFIGTVKTRLKDEEIFLLLVEWLKEIAFSYHMRRKWGYFRFIEGNDVQTHRRWLNPSSNPGFKFTVCVGSVFCTGPPVGSLNRPGFSFLLPPVAVVKTRAIRSTWWRTPDSVARDINTTGLPRSGATP